MVKIKGVSIKKHIISKINKSKVDDNLEPKKTKTVKLHHHHAKPYRKRHIGSFFIFFVIFIIMLVTVVQYRSEINASITSARDWVAYILTNNDNKDYNLSIQSTYGFNLTYDQRNFYGSAIDDSDGGLYVGSDLSDKRAYGIIRISPAFDNTELIKSSFTLTYHKGTTYQSDTTPNLADLNSFAFSDASIDSSLFIQSSTEDSRIDGQTFLKTIWQRVESDSIASKVKTKLITYVGIVNNHPVTLVVNGGTDSNTGKNIYDTVISSINFGDEQEAIVTSTDEIIAKIDSNRSLLDSILVNDIASAATSNPSPSQLSNLPTNSQKVAAYYSPAVPKIYNLFAMDIYINDNLFVEGYTDGWTGTGFFVGQDGYIASNGHVASTDPKGIAIYYAISEAFNYNSQYLDYLVSLTSLTEDDFNDLSEDEALYLIIDTLYKEIPDTAVTKDNDVSNLLVELTDEAPDIDALIQASWYDGEEYAKQSDTILHAELIAADYRVLDGYDGFKASDVAIIKIKGDNYPITKLGSIDSAALGSDLVIIGYPGLATNNDLVEEDENRVTVTTGIVSSKKNVSKSDKKVIETDATIGSGNSGGPAFIADGSVVGIATYTVDGDGYGSGTYNYIRDIQDLKDLAKENDIEFDTNSDTQKEWEEGLNNFYSAHYSKSLDNFEKVKTLYQYVANIDEFISQAKLRIANGEDVKDFPMVTVIIIGSIALIGVGITIFEIIRHRKHHNIYKEQVASGTVQPITPGSPSQKVTIDVKPFKPFTPITPNIVTPNEPLVNSNQTVNSAPVKNIDPVPVLSTDSEIKPVIAPESNTTNPDQIVK